MTLDSTEKPRDSSNKTGWRLFLSWVLANGVGTIVGSIVSNVIYVSTFFVVLITPVGFQRMVQMVIGIFLASSMAAVVEVAIIGAAQAIVLYKRIEKPGLWIFIYAASMFIALLIQLILTSLLNFPLPYFPHFFFVWLIFGGLSSTLQYLIFRRQMPLDKWWITANIIAGSLASIMDNMLWPHSGLSGWSWALVGVIPGATLVWSFREEEKKRIDVNVQPE